MLSKILIETTVIVAAIAMVLIAATHKSNFLTAACWIGAFLVMLLLPGINAEEDER